MNANISFEIKAEAFKIMTGCMAPGKSISNIEDDNERFRAWMDWNVRYEEVINAFIVATTRVVGI